MFKLSSKFKLVALDLLPVYIGRKTIKFDIKHEKDISKRPNKQLLVDISVIAKHDAGTGIQRVVTQVLSNLKLILPSDWALKTIIATKNQKYHYSSDCGHGLVKINHGDIFLALDYSANILPKQRVQLIIWRSQGVKIYTVLYDMLPVQNPDWFTSAGVRNYKNWLKTIAIFSDGLLCISHDVAENAEKYFRKNFKITTKEIVYNVIPLGFEFTKDKEKSCFPNIYISELIKSREFVLIVGTIEPRKGHQDILEAFEILWSNNNPMVLVLIGKAGWKTDLLQEKIKKHKENGKRLFWFENISDVDLEQFYQKSKGVIVASKGEGYGLPVIEALARNKQVLARNIPVLKEVGSNNVVYFDDGNTEEYANQINIWLNNLHLEDMPFKSFSSWKDCTQQILMHIGVIKQNYDQSNQKGIT